MRQKRSAQSRRSTALESLPDRLRSGIHAERDRAALELRALVEEAKAALWRSIRKRSNRNYRGTLVRTLQWFDCSGDFDDVVDLALNGDYEVQCHALQILENQSFRVKKSQLRSARRLIRGLRPRENLTAADIRLLRGGFESALERIERASAADGSAA